MPADGAATLRLFTDRGGVVLAIRCLDEGIDIPSADHALIIASSQNPREFIQRRGRVLRNAPRKAFASIHDLIVLPASGKVADREYPFIHAEVARAIEFSRFSENPSEMDRIRALLAEEGYDPASLQTLGLEDDENE
jgi:superfamily II DNA or RNA helicase